MARRDEEPARREVPLVRIFLSSPADVAEERKLARELIDSELAKGPAFRERVKLELIAWDDPAARIPMLATETPQESVNAARPRPASCDTVIVILWSRMGTPLPDTILKPNGTRYLSGTEWEYEDAVNSPRQPRPQVLLYRRTDKPKLDIDAPDFDEKRAQFKAVNDFFAQFRNADGSLTGGVNEYASPSDFKLLLRQHLEEILCGRVQLSPDNGERRPAGADLLDADWLKNYVQHVQDAFVDHMGSGEQLTLEQANGRYVELLARERNQKHLKIQGHAPGAGTSRVAPLAEFVQSGGVALLLFGEGGAGKTTSVLKLLADAASPALSDAKQPIPFYIKLNLFDWRERGIERLLSLFANTSHLESGTIESLWRTGKRACLFLMDGFNEVGQECQEACALALQEFMQPGPHRYVVTSRPNAQVECLPAQMRGTVVVLETVQLDDDQIRDFLARHGVSGLYGQMVSGLRDLVRNPFLLWALAQSCAGLSGSELPRNRGQLYRTFIDQYIFAEREENKIPPPTQYNYQLVSGLFCPDSPSK